MIFGTTFLVMDLEKKNGTLDRRNVSNVR